MIFQTNQNSWRVSQADRVAFLVDAQSYFIAFTEAVLKAKKYIYILGWDFHSKTKLTEEWTLGALFKHKLAEHPDFEIKILNWDNHLIYSHERQSRTELINAFNAPRMRFYFDGYHPMTASHHQKIVIVDGRIAFSGGMDLTQRRWDTNDHKAEDPRRVDPEGCRYTPFHDVQIGICGPVVRDLFEIFQLRWLRRTHQLVTFEEIEKDIWPSSIRVDLRNAQVGVSRTLPEYDNQHAVRENERLYLDMIEAAQQYIYIESQYFTNLKISEALKKRLRDPKCPDIVICLPSKNAGWIEESTMGTLRSRVLKEIRAADSYDRLRVYYPAVKKRDGTIPVNLHSKVLICDDQYARVGSANLSNRSMGMDGECDVTVYSEDAAGIRKFRDRLLSEHVGMKVHDFAEFLAKEKSLVQALDKIPLREKFLVPFPDDLPPIKNWLLPDSKIVDPERPYPLTNIGRVVLDKRVLPKKRQMIYIFTMLFLVIAATLVWSKSPLREWVDPQKLSEEFSMLGSEPFRSFAILGLFFILCSLMFPLNALLLSVALVFPTGLSIFYCMVGALLSGLFTFFLGRKGWSSPFESSQAKEVEKLLITKGFYVVFLIRLIPLLPFTIMNFIMGSAKVSYRDFTIGTFLGLLPGVVGVAIFGETLKNAILQPGLLTFGILAAFVLIFVIVQRIIGKLVQKQRVN